MGNFVKTGLLIFILTAPQTLLSQDVVWSKLLGSDKDEYTLNHVSDANGNIYVSGETNGSINGSNLGNNDGFIIKVDSSGKTLWSQQFGSAGDEDIQWSAIDNSGCVYIVGSTTGTLSGKHSGKEDIFIVKYDPAGKKEWQRQIGTDSTDIAKGVCTDSKGFIYLTGFTNGKLGQNTSGKTDCLIIKIDKKGNILRTIQFGTSEDDQGYSVTTGTGSDLFVCGTTWGIMAGKNSGFMDGFTGHFSDNLDLLSYNQFGSEGFDVALVLHADKNNNLFIGGSTSGNFAGQQSGEGDCFLLKLNENGDILWNNQFGTEHHDGIRGIDINEAVSDNILISGILNLSPGKAFVRMYRKDGSLVWEKVFDTSGKNGGTSGKDVIFGKKGTLTHLGLTDSDLFGPLIGGNDVFMVKMSIE